MAVRVISESLDILFTSRAPTSPFVCESISLSPENHLQLLHNSQNPEILEKLKLSGVLLLIEGDRRTRIISLKALCFSFHKKKTIFKFFLISPWTHPLSLGRPHSRANETTRVHDRFSLFFCLKFAFSDILTK